MPGIRYWIKKGPEWERVIAAITGVQASLPAGLREELPPPVREAVTEAQANVLSVPTKGVGHTGLRAKVAAGVRVSGGWGLMNITTSMPNANEAPIPPGFEEGGWSHPVFGDRSKIVHQVPLKLGWFIKPFLEKQDDIEEALTEEIEEARDTIAGAG